MNEVIASERRITLSKYFIDFVSYFSLLSLSLSLSLSSLSAQEVKSLQSTPIDQIPSTEIQRALRTGADRWMDPKEHPNVSKLSEKLVEYVKELRLPSDGTKPIYVFISDDLYPDAYAREEANGIYVGVSFGMLMFAKNDAEVKFAIGHELEHRHSQIKTRREKEFGNDDDIRSGTKELDLFERGVWTTLQGAEESEVDIRAIINRLVQKDENPYKAEDFILRYEQQLQGAKRERYRQRASDSTRRQAVGMAISVMSRGFGKHISQSEPTAILNKLATDYASTEDFKTRQKNKIDEAFNYKIPDLEKMYWNIEANLTDDLAPESVSQYYDRVFSWRWKWLSRYIEPQKLSDREYVDYQLRLHAQISHQMDEVREKVIGADYKPASITQLDLLSRLESRRYDTSMDTGGQHPILIEAEVAAEEANSHAFQSMHRHESSDKTKELSELAHSANARRILIRNSYEGPIDPLVSEARKIHDSLNPGDMIPQRYRDLEYQLKTHLKFSGPAISASHDRAHDLASKNLSMILRELTSSSVHAEQASSAFGRLTEREREQNREKILEALFEGAIADLQSAESAKEVDDAVGRFFTLGNRWGGNSLLEGTLGKDFAKACNYMGRVIEAGLDHAKSFDQVMRFFPKERPVPNKNYFGIGYGVPSVELSTQIFEGTFNDEILHKFLDGMSRVLESVGHEGDKEKDLAELVKTLKSLESFIEKIDSWDTRGLITGARFREILRPSVEHFVERIQKHFRELEFAFPDRAVQSCLAVGFPRVLSLTGFSNPRDSSGLIADLQEVAQNQFTREAFKEQFGFYQVYNALKQAGFFDGAPNEEAREAVELHFFNRIKKIGVLIGNIDPEFDPATGAGAFVKHRELKERFGHWALDEPDAPLELVGRVIHEQYHEGQRDAFDSERYEKRFQLSELKKRYQLATKKHEAKSGIEKYEAVIGDTLPYIWPLGVDKNHLVEIAPKDFSERILFTIATRRFFENFWVKKQTDEELKARAEGWCDHTNEVLIGKDPPFEKANTQTLIDYFKSEEISFKPSRERDSVFELIWKRTEATPSMREQLSDPRLIQSLYFDENKVELAKCQLENRFHLVQMALEVRAPASKPHISGLRSGISDMVGFINQQFPKQELVKDHVIDFVEYEIQTNPDESDAFFLHRLNYNNWEQSPLLTVVELPEQVKKHIRTNEDRLELVEYLIGSRTKFPSFIKNMISDWEIKSQEKAENMLKGAKRSFESAHIHVRTFALLPFLDNHTGILGNTTTREKIFQLVLGENVDNVVFRKIFEAYLESTPLSDQRVILSHILSSFTRAKQCGKGASVREVLEAMGPFGIKAGQFIRANGLGSPELMAELDEFFDSALPPNRRKLIEDGRKLFGSRMGRIRIGDRRGSGSINYVSEMFIFPEGALASNAEGQPAALRVQRDHIEGQILNENRIWERAIEKLRKETHPDIKRAANLMDEARLAAFATLGPNGVELNQQIERDAYPAAETVYTSPVDPATGYSIRPVKPVNEIQNWIPTEHQKTASVYELIDGVPISQIKNPVLRGELASQIVSQELKAQDRGLLDPDGHIGNWPVDEKAKQIVRLDYAQMTQLPSDDVEAAREVLNALTYPTVGTSSQKKLAKRFNQTFVVTGASSELTEQEIALAVDQAVRSRSFPVTADPGKRIFHMRESLEIFLSERMNNNGIRVRFHPSFRTILGSNGRLNSFREYLPPGRLTEQMGVHLKVSKVEFIKSKAVQVGKGLMNKCAETVKSLGAKKENKNAD